MNARETYQTLETTGTCYVPRCVDRLVELKEWVSLHHPERRIRYHAEGTEFKLTLETDLNQLLFL